MSSGEFFSPLSLERYELKFLIPESMVDEISDYVEMFCELDPYSEREADKFYKINNIYLDSPNFLFMERRLDGIDHRFNLRIRSYGDTPQLPYFLEIKYKTMGVVKKKRAKVFDENWVNMFLDSGYFDTYEDKILGTDNYLGQFVRLVEAYNARPKVFTQYKRKAYASVIDDYARVTFDRDLRYEERDTFDPTPIEERLSHYDHPLNFYDDNNIILELKCVTKVPMWFVDMIRYFGLNRSSFSKYITGVSEVQLENYNYDFDRLSAI